MGIRSTREISKATAIRRISAVVKMAEEKNFRAIESYSNEADHDVSLFVHNFVRPEFFDCIEKWTNKMLEDVIDQPFYRFSMFDNYTVVD